MTKLAITLDTEPVPDQMKEFKEYDHTNFSRSFIPGDQVEMSEGPNNEEKRTLTIDFIKTLYWSDTTGNLWPTLGNFRLIKRGVNNAAN